MAAVPAGASAEKKTEIFKEMQVTLKAEEEEWRKLLNKELASPELDLHPLRVLFESEVMMQSRDHTAAHGAHAGPIGEARLPGGAKYRATTESEPAVDEALPPGIA